MRGGRPLPERIEAVLFDLDGTLVALAGVRARSERRAESLRRIWISTETPLNYLIGWVERAGLERAAVPAVRVARRLKGISSEAETTLIPGAGELVEALARRVQVGVITSRSRNAARAILVKHGLEPAVSLLVSRSDVWRLKPHPAAIVLAVARLGCPASRALMVGDMPVDIRAARRAQVFALGVTSGFASEAELLAAGADRVVPTVRELGGLLGDAIGSPS